MRSVRSSREQRPRSIRDVASAIASLFAVASLACTGDSRRQAPSATVSANASATAGVAGAPSSAPSATVGPLVDYENEDLPDLDAEPKMLDEQRAEMLKRMRALGAVDDAQASAILAILETSKLAGQGNPEVTTHPISRRECFERRKAAGVRDEKKPLCKAPFMVPIYDPAAETEDKAKVCIDRYEFPGLPCEYPATWITTQNAEDICKTMGKRLCDAHEWEGACAGAVHPPEKEYAFGTPRDTMRGLHNIHREIRWAYGLKKDQSKCGTMSSKSKECTQTGWQCGSNTFPAGAFPECKSSFGVYDQHGNAAEQMLLPLHAEDLGSRGGYGEPEMKGSWFIFQWYEAHEDDCRWRAPSWHDDEGKNHRNYHLGFRCCKDVR
jgi:sulfatase modifying factor 1